MYFGVAAVGVVGAVIARFQASGLAASGAAVSADSRAVIQAFNFFEICLIPVSISEPNGYAPEFLRAE